MKRLILLAAAAAMGGCGGSYVPPSAPATGQPAAPLGRAFDLSVRLPFLEFPSIPARGATLALELDVDGAGDGRHGVTVRYGKAQVGGQAVDVLDLSGGDAVLVESDGAWLISRLGPVQVAGTAFEYRLEGRTGSSGWVVAGTSRESQTGGEGTFDGSRRHRFAVACTDYASGGQVVLLEWSEGGGLTTREQVTEASSDPRLRLTRDALFVINGFSYDNLQRLDPAEEFATAWQAGTGPGSNPRDVALIDAGKAYVSRYEPPFDDLLIIEPRGGARRGAIPLGPLATNPDGTPRPDEITQAGGAAFVALQDIDRTFTRYGDGKLAVIDPRTDRVEKSVPLPGKNPVAVRLLTGRDGRERLFVALAGIYPGLLPQELSGGVAVVDVANRVFERWALDDDDAGGNVGGLELQDERLGYALVTDASYVSRIVAFDPELAELRREVTRTAEYVGGVELDGGGVLAVAEASFFAPRVCLWRVPADPAGLETPLGCAAMPLPPVALEPLD
ncbi:MAG: hypothetical protein MUC67_04440 [Acidobacteria bacterium]|nr:hypothetical protein [Acidobacteriota bacterium]